MQNLLAFSSLQINDLNEFIDVPLPFDQLENMEPESEFILFS